MSAILFSRAIGPVPVDVIIRESHRSVLGVTEKPVETGAKITDHAYLEPKRLFLDFADEFGSATYNALTRFQASRVPFTFVSGFYVYRNMVIKELSADRDVDYPSVINGKCELVEVIIVSTAYVAAEADADSPQSKGKAGGAKSTSAARPTAERAKGTTTVDRAAGTTMRGDAAENSVAPSANRSIISRLAL